MQDYVAAEDSPWQLPYLWCTASFFHSEMGSKCRHHWHPFYLQSADQTHATIPRAGPRESGIVPDLYTHWCGIKNIVRVTVKGQPVWALLDTGCQINTITPWYCHKKNLEILPMSDLFDKEGPYILSVGGSLMTPRLCHCQHSNCCCQKPQWRFDCPGNHKQLTVSHQSSPNPGYHYPRVGGESNEREWDGGSTTPVGPGAIFSRYHYTNGPNLLDASQIICQGWNHLLPPLSPMLLTSSKVRRKLVPLCQSTSANPLLTQWGIHIAFGSRGKRCLCPASPRKGQCGHHSAEHKP